MAIFSIASSFTIFTSLVWDTSILTKQKIKRKKLWIWQMAKTTTIPPIITMPMSQKNRMSGKQNQVKKKKNISQFHNFARENKNCISLDVILFITVVYSSVEFLLDPTTNSSTDDSTHIFTLFLVAQCTTTQYAMPYITLSAQHRAYTSCQMQVNSVILELFGLFCSFLSITFFHSFLLLTQLAKANIGTKTQQWCRRQNTFSNPMNNEK